MTGSAPREIDVSATIERSSFGGLEASTFVLCLLCMVMDGFDVQALSYTAPAIVREWGIVPSALGPVFAIGNVGVLVGALGMSVIADRIGRRPVLIGGSLAFSAMTLVTAQVSSVPALLVMRFLTGVGLGAIAPNASALIGEYSPARRRPANIMIVGVGLTAGAAIGGFVAAGLIPAYGWRSVFIVGGLVPLVVALAMALALPESLQLMVLKGWNRAKLAGWLNRVDPGVGATAECRYLVTDRPAKGAPLAELFREGRGLATGLFWIANFMNLLNLYSLSSWLPTVVRGSGYPNSTAVLVGTVLQVGGTIGTFGLAWLVARRGFAGVLGVTFAVAAAAIATIGRPGLSLPLLFGVVFVAGWGIVGSQPGLNALSGSFYPTAVRSTGVGAGLGVGRLGAIVGPLIGGQLIAAHWSTSAMFLAAAGPALVSAVTMALLRSVIGPRLGARARSNEASG